MNHATPTPRNPKTPTKSDTIPAPPHAHRPPDAAFFADLRKELAIVRLHLTDILVEANGDDVTMRRFQTMVTLKAVRGCEIDIHDIGFGDPDEEKGLSL